MTLNVIMNNHLVLKTPFGQCFKIHTSGNRDYPKSCKPKIFTDRTFTKQFLNSLQASTEFWRRIHSTLESSGNNRLTHIQLINNLSQRLIQHQFEIIPIEIFCSQKNPPSKRTLITQDGVSYRFEPASILLTDKPSEIKKFNNIDSAIHFLSEKSSTEQLTSLGTAFGLTTNHSMGSRGQEKNLLTAIGSKLLSEEIIVSIQRPRLRTTGASTQEVSYPNTRREIPLAPPSTKKNLDSPTTPIEIQGGKLKNQVLKGYEQYKERIQEKELEVIVIQVGVPPNANDTIIMRAESSAVSARQKKLTFEKMGYKANPLILPHDITPKQFASIIADLNNNSKVSGIIVQMPVADRLMTPVRKISPKKDLDALTPDSPQKVPATSSGICRLAEPHLRPNSKIVVLGGRGFVGSGVVSILRQKGYAPKIIDIGDSTEALDDADVVISTVGKGGHVTAAYLKHKPKKLLIDSGFTPTQSGPQGDFTQDALKLAEVITPVPGGIGPTEMAVLAERVLIQDFGDDVPVWQYDGNNIVFNKQQNDVRQSTYSMR